MTGTEPRARPAEAMGGLAKGLAIIEAFGADRRQLSISEAAQLTATSPASARRCLLTLESLGYLSFDGKFFRPTPRMVRLGAAYLETAPLALLARPHLIAAREEGVAYTDEELELGIRTMAVPVRDSSGRVQAAMSAAAFASRVSLDDMAAGFLPVLRGHADRLGRML